jgi:hypothetical protein
MTANMSTNKRPLAPKIKWGSRASTTSLCRHGRARRALAGTFRIRIAFRFARPTDWVARQSERTTATEQSNAATAVTPVGGGAARDPGPRLSSPPRSARSLPLPSSDSARQSPVVSGATTARRLTGVPVREPEVGRRAPTKRDQREASAGVKRAGVKRSLDRRRQAGEWPSPELGDARRAPRRGGRTAEDGAACASGSSAGTWRCAGAEAPSPGSAGKHPSRTDE